MYSVAQRFGNLRKVHNNVVPNVSKCVGDSVCQFIFDVENFSYIVAYSESGTRFNASDRERFVLYPSQGIVQARIENSFLSETRTACTH